MRKPAFCICENKGADTLHSNCDADQRLALFSLHGYTISTIHLLSNSKISSLWAFCACTARFVTQLFGNHNVGFLAMRLIYYNHVHVFAYFITKQ